MGVTMGSSKLYRENETFNDDLRMEMKGWESEWTYINEISNCQRLRVVSENESLDECECLDEWVRHRMSELATGETKRSYCLYAECA